MPDKFKPDVENKENSPYLEIKLDMDKQQVVSSFMSVFSKLAKIGGDALKAKYGKEYFQEIGRKGGKSLKVKYGEDYFKKIRHGEKPSQG